MSAIFYINDEHGLTYSYVDFYNHLQGKSWDKGSAYDNIVALFSDLVGSHRFESHKEFIDALKNANTSIKLSTSGTTGSPKVFQRQLSKFLEAVRHSDDLQSATWALAYDAEHTAGIQTILQAVLTGSTLVDVYRRDAPAVFLAFTKHGVTHISATPTFYRLNFPLPEPLPTIKQVTLGGEVATEKVIQDIRSSVPAASVRNIYASTEFGSLLVSESSVFTIPSRLQNDVKIENNLLHVSHRLMDGSDGWFDTKDEVERIDETRFRFVGRTDEFVNVGGHRVNLLHVEQCVLDVPNVKLARVHSRPNSLLGNVIIAEVLTNENVDEASIVKHLKSKLEPHEVPQRVKLVDELKTTETGKIART